MAATDAQAIDDAFVKALLADAVEVVERTAKREYLEEDEKFAIPASMRVGTKDVMNISSPPNKTEVFTMIAASCGRFFGTSRSTSASEGGSRVMTSETAVQLAAI
eukprot:2178598-Amphidinium_carterae.1